MQSCETGAAVWCRSLKNKIDEKRTIQQLLYNCHFYIFYILRSEFYRLRQNSNWTFKKQLQNKLVVTRLISSLLPTLIKVCLRSIPLGSGASGVKTIWQIQKWSMPFRKLFFWALYRRRIFFGRMLVEVDSKGLSGCQQIICAVKSQELEWKDM